MNKMNWKAPLWAAALALGWLAGVSAQEPAASQKLTLRQAVALAVRNSRELALARLQYNVAEKTAALDRAQFRPNLFTGSGAAYTHGFPLTAAGGAPSVLNTEYVQTVFNPPLRGELRAAEERAETQRLGVDQVRDAVIVRTASAGLELAKVRHSLELLRRERESTQRIADVTRERLAAGLELPVELTRAQLAAARVEQRLVHLEGREEALEGELRGLMGLPADQPLDIVAEELPAGAEQPVRELVEQALASNVSLKQAEAERRAREHILKGQRGGYWPTLDLVGQYSLYSNVNNFDKFFRRFQRHSLNLGVALRIPIFSARTSAAVALAKSDLSAAEIQVNSKRSDLEVEVRRQARRTRELDVNRDVARLELQLAQENLRVLQAQFQEGRANLRDVEKARIEESDKWMAFLDADYERQQGQLELLRTTGQLAKVFQ